MSGFAQFPGSDVRAKLDHPVIDADAHMVECEFAFEDFLKEVGGPRMLERSKAWTGGGVLDRGSRLSWWALPSGPQTSDRAMAMLPRYFKSRMDEAGLDFAHMYPTKGITSLYIRDDELRQASCRALNMLYAEMFSDVGDRIRPVAVIPTYTPEEAIRELEFAVNELGHKAVMIGTEIRGAVPELVARDPGLAGYAERIQSIAIDSPYDYDPFWQKCVDLGVAPACHTAGFGSRALGYRASSSNYVFNHLGGFAAGAEFFCRAVFLGGVTRRFPTLSFAFLEGGGAWAQTLLNDIVEHWEKRHRGVIEENLDPDNLDVALLERLFNQYGDARLTGPRVRQDPHHFLARPGRPDPFDEFEACGMEEVSDLRKLFVDRFYFGCEADDRMTSVAFNRRLNPVGAKLKVLFGSDIGHWDVIDAVSILSEAFSLVEARLMDREDFRQLTFVNPAMLHLSMNPEYFRGTVLEDAAMKLLRETAPTSHPA